MSYSVVVKKIEGNLIFNIFYLEFEKKLNNDIPCHTSHVILIIESHEEVFFMCKNVIGLALSVGGAIIGGKIISNLADKNPKTKEIKEKVKNEYLHRKEFDLEVVKDIAASHKTRPVSYTTDF